MKITKLLLCGILSATMMFCLCACSGRSDSAIESATEQNIADTNNEVNAETFDEESYIDESEEEYEDESEYWDEDDYEDDSVFRELKGIIYIDRPYYTEDDPYSQDDKVIYTGDVEIYTLDPETGITYLARSFPIESAPMNIDLSDSPPFVFDGYDYSNFAYDKDYERMSIPIKASDGSNHVGWINEDGDVTDVTELTMGSRGDFAGLPDQVRGCFGPDDYFYYFEDKMPYRVPINDLTPEAVEAADSYIRLYPDGTVMSQPNLAATGTWYTDASMSQQMTRRDILGTWSQEQCVWLGDGGYIEQTDKSIHRVNGDGSVAEIIPDIADRLNSNPVISPDGSQIAFLSSLRTLSPGVDHGAYIFTVSVDGGDPVKVGEDVSFLYPQAAYNYLLEWR